MPVTTHTCLTLACDVCGAKYEPDDYTVHFATLVEARDCTRIDGWTITADRKVYCGTDDDDHQTALDALMPPEPTIQVAGQLDFEDDTQPQPPT